MRYRLCSVLLICLCLAPFILHADAVVKIMPLGDSITRGGPQGDTAYPGYRYYLDESLRASGYGVDFVGSLSSGYTKFVFDQQHEGHGGYTTSMMVGTSSFSPLAAWLAASPTPDIVLLHIGTNDALYGVSPATRLANVRQIVALLRQKNPNVRVMMAQIIPTGNATLNVQSGLIAYNQALPPLAVSLSTPSSPVTVVDLYTGYDGIVDNQPDGVHPKTTGERKMAAAWQRALAPVLAGTSPAPAPTTVATTKPTTVTPTPIPAGRPIPGTLEAEDYNTGGEGMAYHDITASNQGGAYRNDGVDIESLSSGGYAVCYVRDGEWLRYSVPVAAAGQYYATFRVASWGTVAHAIEVLVNDNPAATVTVPATGSYAAWTTATTTLTLPSGTCSLKLRFVGDGQNLDRVVFTPVAVTTAPTTKPTTVATTPIPAGRPIPGTLEAEDYNTGGEGVAYHDTTPTNLEGAYRNDGVDIESLSSGGYAVCYVRDGEWLKYTVSVANAGQYAAAFRVASWGTVAHAIEVSVNDNAAVTVPVPATGSYDAWTTATTTLTLPSGTCSLKLRFVGDGQNLDRIAFTPVAVTTIPTTRPPTTVPTTLGGAVGIPATVQAESYLAGGEGVAYHDTTAGNQGGAYRSDGVDIAYAPSIGSYVVTQIKPGEWLDYSVNAPEERDYQLAFRLSSPSGGRYFEMKVDGRSEVMVITPQTGSYDAYTWISTQLRMTSGVHRIRVQFYGEGQNLDAFSLA